jgi:hypothetical protein
MDSAFWNPLRFIANSSEGNQVIQNPLQVRRLDWDSDFFGAEMFKIDFMSEDLNLDFFLKMLPEKAPGRRSHIFAEVPTEAGKSIQKLCRAGFIIESK